MSKFKKIIFTIVLMFTLSGCDVSYNLTIDKDLKVKEEVTALEEIEFNDLAHDFLLDRISVSHSNRYEEIYDFSAISEGTKMGNRLFKSYKSISEYQNESSVFKDLVKNYTITQSGNIINFNATINDSIYDKDNIAYIITPQNLLINIDVPFKVTNNNANTKNGNIYTWKIDENNRTANIILSFDKNRLSNHIYILNIGISYVILLVAGIILTVSVITFIIYNKIRSINKI